MSLRFSIIVPVYNAEQFLEICIKSIVEQTYHKIELLLVDDGSTDRSADICAAWMSKDERIRYFRQKNAGVSAARNLGLEKATGELIAFVDADDYIDLSFCNEMQRFFCDKKLDLAFCERRDIYPSSKVLITGNNSSKFVKIPSIEYEYDGYKERRAVWGAVYRREILSGLQFPNEIFVGEDALFLANAIKASQHIIYYDKALYNYRIQKESAYFGTFTPQKATEIDAWIHISEVFEKNSIARLSAEALCADTATTMLARYAGDIGFEKVYINKIIRVYRNKFSKLIWYDYKKSRKFTKHILYGLFPHVFLKYWEWKNEKNRNSNIV